MKDLEKAIQQCDGTALQRIASREKAPANNTEQAALIFNELFRQLRAAFPASVAHIKTQDDLNEFRRQWLLAFAENGITTIAQVDTGMQIARRQETPWLPSPGQFVAWCREGSMRVAGMPSDSELVEMVLLYSRERGYLASPEDYPWAHPAHYWMVTKLYSDMRVKGWTDSELLGGARKELSAMCARIQRGETIPVPVPVLPHKPPPPLSREEGLKKISEIRRQLGLTRK